MEEDIIGKKIEQRGMVEKVTGTALYVHDMEMQGMLYGRILCSPYAHARIIGIDKAEAENIPGVWTILTGEDLPYKVGSCMVDKPILAVDKVRYYGEPVAAVAAVSEEIAKIAINKIKVEYEELKPIMDVEESLKGASPLIHENPAGYEHLGSFFPVENSNIANHYKIRKGDVKEGFSQSDKIVENHFFLPQISHVTMETHCSIAKWFPGNRVKIWTSAQSPFAVRNLVSRALELSQEKVTVNIPNVGGGFGAKSNAHLEPLATCLSIATNGRPVKIVATRQEEFKMIPVRQGLLAKIKTGVTKEGRIVSQEIEYLWDGGAYVDFAISISRAAGAAGTGPYEVENIKLDSYTLYTNKTPGTAYRGFGYAEFLWGIERQMDIVAQEIGMDPYEFRQKNILRPGSITATGEEIFTHSGNAAKCLEEVAKEIGWQSDSLIKVKQGCNKVRCKGIAALYKSPAMPTNAGTGAIIQFNENGTVKLSVSLTDYGQGTHTALAQIVSDQLKMPLDKIEVVREKNTAYEPYDWQSVASKGLFLSGNAVINACEDLKEQMMDLACQILRASPGDLEFASEKILLKHSPAKYLKYNELAMGYTYTNGNAIGGPLIGRGTYIPQGLTFLDKETGQGYPALDWTFGAHAVVVELDVETGEYEIIKLVSAFDIGKAINTTGVIGQIEGGVIQGIGSTNMEAYQHDSQGRLLTDSFTDYKIPTIKDLPTEFVPIIIETPQIDGPYGARGIGEHPMLSVSPVIANAISKATGKQLKDLPIIPEVIVNK